MNVSIIDDHRLITDSLKSLLLQNERFHSVNTYRGAKEFLAEVESKPLPDVLLSDLVMPDMNGLKLIELIRLKYVNSNIKIIILSSLMDVQTIRQSIRIGANGFLSKDISVDELITAIFEVAEGQQYISENLRPSLLKSVFVEEQVIYHLSPREKEVLQLVCSGQTIKEIAYNLNLSQHTVQYYHRNVMSKLKVKRTHDLIVYAIQHGLYIPDLGAK